MLQQTIFKVIFPLFLSLGVISQTEATEVAGFLVDSGTPIERNDPPKSYVDLPKDKSKDVSDKVLTGVAANSTQSEQDQKTKEDKDTNYFDIFEFQVEGNTKLTKMEVEAAVYPQMGEKKRKLLPM